MKAFTAACYQPGLPSCPLKPGVKGPRLLGWRFYVMFLSWAFCRACGHISRPKGTHGSGRPSDFESQRVVGLFRPLSCSTMNQLGRCTKALEALLFPSEEELAAGCHSCSCARNCPCSVVLMWNRVSICVLLLLRVLYRVLRSVSRTLHHASARALAEVFSSLGSFLQCL